MAEINDISIIETNAYYPIVLMPQGVKDFAKESADIFNIDNHSSIFSYSSRYQDLKKKKDELQRKTIEHYKLTKPQPPQLPIPHKPPIPPEKTREINKRILKVDKLIIMNALFFLAGALYAPEGHLNIWWIGLMTSIFVFISAKYLISFNTIKKTVPLKKTELNLAESRYQNLLEEHEEMMKIYHEYMKKYQNEKIAFTNELKEFNRDILGYEKSFTKLMALNIIKPKSKPTRLDGHSLKGRTEISFLENYLLPNFHNKIKINMGLGTYSPFIPDFVFDDGDLCIDIEIDEPYDVSEKKPIHYIGSDDDKRNTFFLDKNWFVLRFAEEQIIKHPEKCVATIKQLVKTIKELNVSHYSSVYLPVVRRWTYEEAFLMAKNNFRN